MGADSRTSGRGGPLASTRDTSPIPVGRLRPRLLLTGHRSGVTGAERGENGATRVASSDSSIRRTISSGSIYYPVYTDYTRRSTFGRSRRSRARARRPFGPCTVPFPMTNAEGLATIGIVGDAHHRCRRLDYSSTGVIDPVAPDANPSAPTATGADEHGRASVEPPSRSLLPLRGV